MKQQRGQAGYMLIEMVLVFTIIGLLLGIGMPVASKVVRRSRLEGDVARFARTLRTAGELAVYYGRELHIVIDVTDGYYTIYDPFREPEEDWTKREEPGEGREEAGRDAAGSETSGSETASRDVAGSGVAGKEDNVAPEVIDKYQIDYSYLEPLMETQGLDRCYIEQIDFVNGTHQYSGELILFATGQGWGASVVFNLIDDRNERRRWVQCNRNTVRVIQSRQPLEMIEPRTEVSMSSPL